MGHLRRQCRDPQAYFDLRWHFYDLRSLAELKLFQNVRHFHGLLAGLLGEFSKQQRRVEARKLVWMAAAIAIGGAGVGAAIALPVRAVLGGRMSVGTMVFVLGLIAILQMRPLGVLPECRTPVPLQPLRDRSLPRY